MYNQEYRLIWVEKIKDRKAKEEIDGGYCGIYEGIWNKQKYG